MQKKLNDTEMATMLNDYFSSVFTCEDTTFFPAVDQISSPLISDSIEFTPEVFVTKSWTYTIVKILDQMAGQFH